MNRSLLVTIVASIAPLAIAPSLSAQVNVTVTADNAYVLGIGDENGIKFGFEVPPVINVDAGQIFSCGSGPESYSIQANTSDTYLYIAAWGDDAQSQGLLGQFWYGANAPIYTGVDPRPGAWRVFATGKDYDLTSGAPSFLEINMYVYLANHKLGPTTGSIGWRGLVDGGFGKLVFGETNASAGGVFPVACGINAAARWMWFDRFPGDGSAFNSNPGPDGQAEFLIFRIATAELPGFPWKNRGGASAPSENVPAPKLVGSGRLTSGSYSTLSMTGAPALARCLLVAATTASPFESACGTLVANPPVLVLPAVANDAGGVSISGGWPTGVPAGTSLFFQFAVEDARAPCGFSLSNAVEAFGQ